MFFGLEYGFDYVVRTLEAFTVGLVVWDSEFRVGADDSSAVVDVVAGGIIGDSAWLAEGKPVRDTVGDVLGLDAGELVGDAVEASVGPSVSIVGATIGVIVTVLLVSANVGASSSFVYVFKVFWVC